jgi:hypothetical protein
VQGPVTDKAALKSAYDELIASEEFSSATSSSTAAEESVRKRLGLATAAFQNVA